jgi:hypothetical protein
MRDAAIDWNLCRDVVLIVRPAIETVTPVLLHFLTHSAQYGFSSRMPK